MFEQLKALIEDENRVITAGIDEKYYSDHLGHIKVKPAAVVIVASTDEVSKVLDFANLHHIPVVPRGAGTGLTGGTVPTEDSIVIDLTKLNRIQHLDKETMTLTVQAGVLLEEVQAFAESNGLFYPPDPGEKASTIGGNISTNAGGMRAVKYGVTRDYVRSIEVVLANGSIVELGSKNIKDSTGLDLKDLLIGSEGTLGIITEAKLRLIPKPQIARSVLVPFQTLEEGIDTVLDIKASGVDVAAIEFVQKEAISLSEQYLKIEFPTHKGNAYLIFTFDGDTASHVRDNYEKVRELCDQHNALDFLVLEDEESFEITWQIRGAIVKAVESVSVQEPIDIVVPINKSAEFVKYTKAISNRHQVSIQSFGHAGDGNVHLCIIKGTLKEEEWQEKLQLVLEDLYQKAAELGGLPSGEHGIGLTKLKYYLDYANEVQITLMRNLKKAFDVNQILNPNKAY